MSCCTEAAHIAARGFIALSLDITDEQCDTLVGAMSEAPTDQPLQLG